MTLIAGAVAVITIYLLLQMFRSANPAVLARTVKFGGGVLALAVAAFTGLRGELAVAIPLGIFGAGLLGWTPLANAGFGNVGGLFGGLFGGGAARPSGQASRVRSQFLDMRLDHDTGQLTGLIVAGPHAGRDLGEFDLTGLLAMVPAFDAESVALLESYLDRRFPAWRQNAQGDAAGGQRRSAASGKMTAEEAYQILGLQPGAGRDDISRAHKSLMKKLHPDQGGSTYLAARVNEAKDTLLRTHNG
ncbi:DnaJ domain-containing protein [Bradyrhizobium sp. 5.13L]